MRAGDGGEFGGIGGACLLLAQLSSSGCVGANVHAYSVTSKRAGPGISDLSRPPPLLDQPSPGAPDPPVLRSPDPRVVVVSMAPAAAVTTKAIGLGLDGGFLYDRSPEGVFGPSSALSISGLGLGAGGRLLSWENGERARPGTLYAEARLGALETRSQNKESNGWYLLGAGWAWDPSRRAQGPEEALCLNNFCLRLSHFLGVGTEVAFSFSVPTFGLHFWSD